MIPRMPNNSIQIIQYVFVKNVYSVPVPESASTRKVDERSRYTEIRLVQTVHGGSLERKFCNTDCWLEL